MNSACWNFHNLWQCFQLSSTQLLCCQNHMVLLDHYSFPLVESTYRFHIESCFISPFYFSNSNTSKLSTIDCSLYSFSALKFISMFNIISSIAYKNCIEKLLFKIIIHIQEEPRLCKVNWPVPRYLADKLPL